MGHLWLYWLWIYCALCWYALAYDNDGAIEELDAIEVNVIFTSSVDNGLDSAKYEHEQQNRLFRLHKDRFEVDDRREDVNAFCTLHHLDIRSCGVLTDEVDRQLAQTVVIANREKKRHREAINNEIDNVLLFASTAAAGRVIEEDQSLAVETLEQIADVMVQELRSRPGRCPCLRSPGGATCQCKEEDWFSQRTAVIHSCLLRADSSTRILEEILSQIAGKDQTSQAVSQSLTSIWILNFGYSIEEGELLRNEDKIIKRSSAIAHWDLSSSSAFFHDASASTLLDCDVFVVNVFNCTDYFEVPTLMILQAVSRRMMEERASSFHQSLVERPHHFLYLHTKGVSYERSHEAIENWRAMMLHSLVNHHDMCYYLLLSDLFDVVGSEYSGIHRFLSGNYFWATAEYLANLKPLQLGHSNKYDAERWILSADHPRVYVPFNSGVNLNDFTLPLEAFLGSTTYAAESKTTRTTATTSSSSTATATAFIQERLSYLNTTHCVGRILPKAES